MQVQPYAPLLFIACADASRGIKAKNAELQRCYEDKDKLFAELAKLRGKLDLLMAQQDGVDSADLLRQVREQRDKAVADAEVNCSASRTCKM